MTQVVISDILPYTQTVANQNQTIFSTDWTANYASDVVVYYTPVGDAPDDVTQILPYPADYSVAFIGDGLIVQVTLVTPAINTGDIVTIVRNTPADRVNLYTNTNFTPSMLNNDFGILTLVDQQAQLVNQLVGPRYNYSAQIDTVVDTILPILTANQGWVKNNADTAIIGYTFPAGGIAPANDTYVLLTPDDTGLPNSFALSSLTTGFLVNDVTHSALTTTSIFGQANQITVTNGNGIGNTTISVANNPIIPGTAGMGIPIGNTAQRVTPIGNIGLRYNTDLASIEYYNGISWAQLNNDTQVQPGLINQLAWYSANGSSISGLATGDNGVLVTSNTGVPSISSTLPIAVQDNITALGTISSITTPLGITFGGTGSSTVITLPTASSWAGWDANKNFSAEGFIPAYVTTATAAATTTLTVGSAQQQFFTGSTTQSVVMPVTSTLVLGQYWTITNMSTGVVTIKSSGGNTILALPASSETSVTCILTSGTSATSWTTTPAVSGSGTVNAGTLGQLAYYATNGTALTGGQLGNVLGTATNDNAATGYVGEFISSQVLAASAISLTNTTAANITSIGLTAGDWSITGNIVFAGSVTGSSTYQLWANTSSATAPDISLQNTILETGSFTSGTGTNIPPLRISTAAPVTVYLSAIASFNGTLTGCGGIFARRVR